MVGLVIVSHSAPLAAGVVELARQMGGADVAIEPAGGMADGSVGTDAVAVAEAIGRADKGDGVLVLMDLGSAVMSAELAVEMTEGAAKRVKLCAAPLVEGAIAAAVAARLGRSLDEVATEATAGLAPKQAHLGEGPSAPPPTVPSPAVEGERELRVTVPNPLGLHARPAARFVQTAGRFDAAVTVTNETSGRGPVRADSLTAVATLGARMGHDLVIRASGADAVAVLAALQELAEDDFGDREAPQQTTPVPPREPAGPAGSLGGVAAGAGIAIGPLWWLERTPVEVVREPVADPDADWERLEDALRRARADVAGDRKRAAVSGDRGGAAILEAHELLLDDAALTGPARAGIYEDRKSAEWSWSDSVRSAAGAYRELDDEYMRARAADVEEIGRRVLVHLAGGVDPVGPQPEGTILATDELTVGDALALDSATVQGIVMARGGATSHAAMLARSAGIPAVVGLGDALLEVPGGTHVIVDGDRGAVLIDPDGPIVDEYRAIIERSAAEAVEARAAAAAPAVTADGITIEVAANAMSVADVASGVAAGADGVGLFRVEYLFMERAAPPSEEELFDALSSSARAIDGRPFTVRTLDAGADKPVPYLDQRTEANPFLGERGIRLMRVHPDLLDLQCRVVARLALEHHVRVMFPMVSTIAEFRQARDCVRQQGELLSAGDGEAKSIEIGVMVEVPSVALQAGTFAAEVDFFSIGTNDLAQYTMAAERNNERLGGLADPLQPAVLRLINLVCDAAASRGRWVGVCGELAGDADATALLIGLGVRELSMSPPSIPAVKAAVRKTETEAARILASEALELESATEVRGRCREAGGQS